MLISIPASETMDTLRDKAELEDMISGRKRHQLIGKNQTTEKREE